MLDLEGGEGKGITNSKDMKENVVISPSEIVCQRLSEGTRERASQDFIPAAVGSQAVGIPTANGSF